MDVRYLAFVVVALLAPAMVPKAWLWGSDFSPGPLGGGSVIAILCWPAWVVVHIALSGIVLIRWPAVKKAFRALRRREPTSLATKACCGLTVALALIWLTGLAGYMTVLLAWL
jgi:hypothetical protein